MAENHIGIYNFEPMIRGDAFRALDIAEISQGGVPLAVTSARMQVRDKFNSVLLDWTPAITGAGSNIVTLSEKTAPEMQSLPPGVHTYDLEVIWAIDGAKKTIMKGRFPIDADTTRTV